MNSTITNSSSAMEIPVAAPPSASLRCLHRFANGKRCRQLGSESQSGLCAHHFRLSTVAALSTSRKDSADLSAELLPELSVSSSPLDLRRFLARLLVLVSQGRISTRRAAVLSYITNQLLHSAVPSKPKPEPRLLKSSLLRLARNVAEQTPSSRASQ